MGGQPGGGPLPLQAVPSLPPRPAVRGFGAVGPYRRRDEGAAVSLRLVPITISDAKAFVAEVHRHRDPPEPGLFAVAAAHAVGIVGVAIIGRPSARELQDGYTAEVTRVAVANGAKNACSLLYGAAWRACRALGYQRLVTYTLTAEPGTSLRAAGW